VIIDGHNDLVSRIWRGDEIRHVHLDEAADADFAGGFFALYVPSPKPADPTTAHYELPLPEPIPRDEAARVADELYDVFRSLPVRLATSPYDFQPGRVAAILHLEGAEPLAADLSDLEAWYARGLRSVGLVWSRANAFAEGVPFRFPSTPDTGPGLTTAGRELVRECNTLGIVVDLSHLNEAGFRHVGYIAGRIGIDHVAFGSDFDGALVPGDLGGISGLPKLVDALRAGGFDDDAVAKVTHRNWLRVLGDTWR
jgi:membrane dipeptidase